jgi:hypothetical protein
MGPVWKGRLGGCVQGAVSDLGAILKNVLVDGRSEMRRSLRRPVISAAGFCLFESNAELDARTTETGPRRINLE